MKQGKHNVLIPFLSAIIIIFLSTCSTPISIKSTQSNSVPGTNHIEGLQGAPKIKINIGFSGNIWSASFTEDVNSVFLNTSVGEAGLFDIETGRELLNFGDSNSVSMSCLSGGGNFVLLGTENGAQLYDISTGRNIRTFDVGKRIWTIGFSQDASLIATTDKDVVRVWNTKTGELIGRLKGHRKRIEDMAFSPDGKYLVTGSWDNTARIWEIKNSKQVHLIRLKESVASVEFSQDGTHLLTSAGDTTVWRIDGWSKTRTIPRTSAATFSPNGKLVAVLQKPGVVIWDIQSGKKLRVFNVHTWATRPPLRFSPDGNYILATAGSTAYIWDIESQETVQVIHGQKERINNFTLSPDGKHMYVAYNNDTYLREWNYETGELINSWGPHNDGVKSVAITDDGRYLLTSSKEVIIWDTETGFEIQRLSHDKSVYETTISPDGEYAVTAELGSEQFSVWDIDKGTVIGKSSVHSGVINSVLYSNDGKYIISCAQDINVYDAQSLTLIKTIPTPFKSEINKYGRIHSADLSHNGKYLVIGPQSTADSLLLELPSCQEIQEYEWQGGSITDIAFSPNDDELATLTAGGTLTIWDTKSGEKKSKIVLKSQHTSTVEYSKDGKILIIGASGGELFYYSTQDGTLRRTSGKIGNGEWVTWTEEGYFIGSEKAINDHVYILDNSATMEIGRFFETYYRPDLVESTLISNSIASSSVPPKISDGYRPLPQVSISVETQEGIFQNFKDGIDNPTIHIEKDEINVQLTAKDTGGGVAEIRLYSNGIRVGDKERGLSVIRDSNRDQSVENYIRKFAVHLLPGENRLRAVALSDDLIEGPSVELVIEKEDITNLSPTLHVVAVGIDSYLNPRYELNYAVADATSFIEGLQQYSGTLFDTIEVQMLLNEKAHQNGVKRVLRTLSDVVEPFDVFIFFYAGHGIAFDDINARTNFYFVLQSVTQMTSEDNIKKEGLSGDEFAHLVSLIPAQKQLLVIDSCQSGAISQAFTKRGAAEEIALSRLSRSTGSALIAASRQNQYAQEFPTLEQGALTYALLTGLGGKAALSSGEITVGSLKSYVESALPAITQEVLGQPQFPTGFIFGQDFPIAIQ